ncbi:MAG: hypothetical protein ACLP6E_09560 [Acidimicrobiales bacterium]
MSPIRRRRQRHPRNGGISITDAPSAHVSSPHASIPDPSIADTSSADLSASADVSASASDVVSVPDTATGDEDEPHGIEDKEKDKEQHATEPLTATTVVVVGAGSPEGVALVLGLSSTGHSVVAVDHDPLAAGLRLAPLGAVIPATDHSEFDKALAEVVRSSEARAVLAPLVGDMSHLAGSRKLLEDEGASVWLPAREVFDLCDDPVALGNVLTSSGLPEDKTGLGPGVELPATRRDFSVDVIVDRDHDLITAVSCWIQAKRGDTTSAAETFNDPRLLELLRAVCAAMRMEGPAVIEGYEADFRIRLSRIRPGFSQFSPLARAAGVDVVSLALSGTLGHRLPPPLLTQRSGVRMLQYLDQVFEG